MSGVNSLDHLQRRRSVVGDAHDVAPVGQHLGEQARGVLVVVHDQDAHAAR